MNSNERHNMSSSTEQGNQRKEEKMMSTPHLKPTVSKKGKAMTMSTTKQRKQREEEKMMSTSHLDESTLRWFEDRRKWRERQRQLMNLFLAAARIDPETADVKFEMGSPKNPYNLYQN